MLRYFYENVGTNIKMCLKLLFLWIHIWTPLTVTSASLRVEPDVFIHIGLFRTADLSKESCQNLVIL